MVAGPAAESRDPPVRRVAEVTLARLGLPINGEDTKGGAEGISFEPNPVASMPSIHLAVTVLLLIVAGGARRVWRGTAVAYAALMAVALVYLGEHYVLDIAAGALAAWLGWVAAGWTTGRLPAVTSWMYRSNQGKLGWARTEAV